MRQVLLLIVALTGFFFAACESSGGGSTPDPGRGGSTNSAADSPSGGGETSSRAASPRAGTGAEFTEEQRALIDSALRAFRKDERDWPSLRNEWIAIGPGATIVLVETLIKYMVAAHVGNFPEGYDRVRRELLLLGDRAVPTLAAILKKPNWVDPQGRQENLPTGMINELIEIMMVSTSAAMPHLLELAQSGSTASVRRGSILALGRIGDPEGISICIRQLQRGADWPERMVAARALAQTKEDRATRALIAGLEDEDTTVAQECARSLAVQQAQEALPALDRRREQARTAQDYRLAAACGSAAKAIRRAQ